MGRFGDEVRRGFGKAVQIGLLVTLVGLLGERLLADDATAFSYEDLNVQELYSQPTYGDLIAMVKKISRVEKLVFEIACDHGDSKLVAASTVMVQRMQATKNALARALVATGLEGSEGSESLEEVVMMLSERQEIPTVAPLAEQVKTFADLKKSCADLYKSTCNFIDANKHKGLKGRLKQHTAHKLIKRLKSLAKSGHILIFP